MTKLSVTFIADHLALDLLNTSIVGANVELLSDDTAVLNWLSAAGVHIPPLRVSNGDDRVSADVRALREQLRSLVEQFCGKRFIKPNFSELAKVNEILARANNYYEIAPRPTDLRNAPRARADRGEDRIGQTSPFAIFQRQRWRESSDLLIPIAAAVADLICNVDFTKVMRCENPRCTMWFLDVSINHTRRWCSMAKCGNQAKAAAHRRKLKARLAQN